MKHMVPVNSVYCSIHALLVPKLQFVMETPERDQRIVMNLGIKLIMQFDRKYFLLISTLTRRSFIVWQW